MRLFFALPIPQDLKNLIEFTQQGLSNFNSLITWARSNQAHITLRFLGNQPEEKLSAIVKHSKVVVNNTSSFALSGPVLKFFPSVKYPRVLLIDFEEGKQEFLNLQKKLDEALQKTGLIFKNPKVTPHVTIGRIKEKVTSCERQALILRLSKATRKPPRFTSPRFTSVDLAVKVQEIHLVQSQLTPQGPIYTTLNHWRLN